MIDIPSDLLFALRANGLSSRLLAARDQAFDPMPVIKLFNPVGAATWLATEIGDDGDTLFGLADLGFGCPELGYFSLAELAEVRLPFGLGIERDIGFASAQRLSTWAAWSRRAGSILHAEMIFRRTASAANDELPPAGG
ncbi:DUF2958 domain-containing protein [Sphingopyxis fribergensis]